MYQTCVLVAACLLFEKEAYVKYTKACQVEQGYDKHATNYLCILTGD